MYFHVLNICIYLCYYIKILSNTSTVYTRLAQFQCDWSKFLALSVDSGFFFGWAQSRLFSKQHIGTWVPPQISDVIAIIATHGTRLFLCLSFIPSLFVPFNLTRHRQAIVIFFLCLFIPIHYPFQYSQKFQRYCSVDHLSVHSKRKRFRQGNSPQYFVDLYHYIGI